MNTKTCILLTLLFTLMSCGSKDDETTPGTISNPSYSYKDLLIRQYNNISGLEAIHNSNITCENDDCPEGIAQITSSTELGDSYSVCTGFLIAKDVLMTNSHCVPEYLSDAGVDCSTRLSVYFPASQTKANFERVYCKEIIYNDDYDDGLDYAFIKLSKKLDRKVFPVVRSGAFKEASKIQTWNMSPNQDRSHEGIIKKQICDVVHSSFIKPNFNHANYPYITLGDCTVIGGNSGSPLLDMAGNAIGIVNIRYVREFLDKIYSEFSLNFTSSMKNMAGGQNFSCMFFPKSDYTMGDTRANCDPKEISSGKKNKFSDKISSSSYMTISDIIDGQKLPLIGLAITSNTTPEIEDFYKWELTYNNDLDIYLSVPRCYKEDKAILRNFITSEKDMRLPGHQITNTFNAFGQYHPSKSQRSYTIRERRIHSSVTVGPHDLYKFEILNKTGYSFNPLTSIFNKEIEKCL
jgi:hypothetical protein